MKRVLILSFLLLTFALSAANAEFRPYGSVRIGYWYENENEDWSGTGENELNLNTAMQPNSNFGAHLINGDLAGRVEFGSTGNIRMLYGKYKMNGWSLLIGQDYSNLRQVSKQVYGNDNFLVRWGALDDGLKAQVRVEMDNGFYFSLFRPEKIDAISPGQDKKALVPKINLGYKTKLADNIAFHGTGGFNFYTYNDNDGPMDDTVLSFVAGLLLDIDLDPMMIRAHLNFGQNTGNYGIGSVTPNTAMYDSSKSEVVNVHTMGGFADFTYKYTDTTNFTAGLGYVSSDSDLFDNADTAMAVYLQMAYKLNRALTLTPEVGMLNGMKDKNDRDQGSMLYFGTQLRMDF